MRELGADGMVNRNELLQLLDDFELCPQMMSRKHVFDVFHAADNGEVGAANAMNRVRPALSA